MDDFKLPAKDFRSLLFCLLLIIHLQQESSPSTVSCLSVSLQGWKSLFAVVYNTAYRKWNLQSWQEIGFCCWTYAFCWKWVPVIPKVSSVGVPVAVHYETEFGIELSPQFNHRVHIKLWWGWSSETSAPLSVSWGEGSLLGSWTQSLEQSCLSLSSAEPQRTSSVPGAYLIVKAGLVL